MDTKTIIIICAVVLVVLIISITVYILTVGNYTRVLCGRSTLKATLPPMADTKLPLSQEGNRPYSFWLYIINLPENSEFETDVNNYNQSFIDMGRQIFPITQKLHRLRFQIAYKDNLDMVNYYNLMLIKPRFRPGQIMFWL